MLKEAGDKVTAEEKAEVEEKLTALKAVKDGDDHQAIKKRLMNLLTSRKKSVRRCIKHSLTPQLRPAPPPTNQKDEPVDAEFKEKEVGITSSPLMLQGVIFDLDGTLVDTMPIWEATIAEVFTAGGFPYNREIYNRIMRAPIDQVAEELKQEFGLSANVEKMLAPLEQTFLRLVDSTKIEKDARGRDHY